MMTGKLISPDRPAVLAVMVLTTTILAAGCAEAAELSSSQSDTTAQRYEEMQQHPYVGMWITADGHIRQELLPNLRYDEARGSRTSAYQGRYEVKGEQIDYWDDTGFTAYGTFVSQDELHHGGMIFYRER